MSGADPTLRRDSLKGTSLLTKVSHHPPISACHAESENFVFWQGEGGRVQVELGGKGSQGGSGTLSGLISTVPSPSPNPTPDMKWKNKFWGKSLEIVPVGTVNVSLPR